MMPDDKVPTSIVERIMDSADKATAKELSNLESAVAKLVMNLNTPPRIEDVNRLVEGLKNVIEHEVDDKLNNIDKKLEDLSGCSSSMLEKVDTFLTRIKWVAGIVVIVVSIAVAVISYVTNLTEQTIKADTAVKLKVIEEKYEEASKARKEEFNELLKEINKLHSAD